MNGMVGILSILYILSKTSPPPRPGARAAAGLVRLQVFPMERHDSFRYPSRAVADSSPVTGRDEPGQPHGR